MQRPSVTAPIIGARTITHFEDNLGTIDWTLDDEQIDRLNLVSERPLPYPYSVLAWASRRAQTGLA